MPLPRLDKLKAKQSRSGLGRPSGAFTQHDKLKTLAALLADRPAGVDLATVALELNVSTRSARRYLEHFEREGREKGNKEIESLPAMPDTPRVWRIKPFERGRTITLRRSQAYAILAARRVFDVTRGSALFDEVDLVLRQLAQVAGRPMKGEIASNTGLADRLLFVPEIVRTNPNKGEELDDLFRAVADLRMLSFRYAYPTPGRAASGPGPATRAPERVTLHPYAMILHRGAIHAVGLDVECREIGTFFLDRMSETSASEAERFELPDGFQVDDYVQGEFGVGQVLHPRRVLVEFDPPAAEEVRTRRVHPSQRLAVAADGRVRLSMTVGDLEPVTAWVLAFGRAARVIEPAELRTAVVEEMHGALARYGR